jgi:hypothetical protein
MQAIERAASLLKVSEFRLFSEAYLTTFGDRAEQADLFDLFAQFMMFGEVPYWADTFAKHVLDDLAANRIVQLNSFCLMNVSPRLGDKPDLSFSIGD